MNENKIFLTLEMANNHMGSVEHGKKIIEEFAAVMKGRELFDAAFKLQYRALDAFIARTSLVALMSSISRDLKKPEFLTMSVANCSIACGKMASKRWSLRLMSLLWMT